METERLYAGIQHEDEVTGVSVRIDGCWHSLGGTMGAHSVARLILDDFLGDSVGPELCEQFAASVIAHLPSPDRWELPANEIKKALAAIAAGNVT